MAGVRVGCGRGVRGCDVLEQVPEVIGGGRGKGSRLGT